MELADVHEGFRTRISGAFHRLADAFTELIERAKADGALRPDTDAKALGQFVVAAIEGGILLCKVHKSSVPLASSLRAAEAHLASHRVRDA